jgi:AcrR family transcriptional regulator
MPPRAQLIPRKSPKQRRSRVTVEAILTATSRVLVQDGYAKTSTNRVAKVAGVSIGSLYQYFPSKEALVLALVNRHCEQMLNLLIESGPSMLEAPLDVAIRTYVRTMLAAHSVDPALHRVLVTQALHLGLDVIAGMEKTAREVVQSYLEHRKDDIMVMDTELAAFVLVTAVEAVTHNAVVNQPHHLRSGALEDEICALILRYLQGGDASARASA